MGKNLAFNVESREISVSVYSRNRFVVDDLLIEAKEKNIKGTCTIDELVNSLETPRKILIIIKAETPVDETIEKLVPYLSKGDMIINGGNSYFKLQVC